MECIITKKQKYFWTNSRWCGRPHLQLVLMLYIFLCQSSTPHACSSLLYRETWYTETFTRWPAIDRRAADKSDHCGNLYLSLSLIVCLETLRHRRHCHDLMYWNVYFKSTEDAGQYQRLIRLEIKIPSLMSGHIKGEKENTKAHNYIKPQHQINTWHITHHLHIYSWQITLLKSWKSILFL